MTLHDFGRMVCERNQRLADKVEPHMTAEEKAEYLQFRGDLVHDLALVDEVFAKPTVRIISLPRLVHYERLSADERSASEES